MSDAANIVSDPRQPNNINTLRFLGAFLVLFGHTFALCYGPGGGHDPISQWMMPYTAYQAKLPGIGVAMFFVLSGYLVTASFLNRGSLLVYVESRALRIFPALWAALLFSVCVVGPLATTLDLADYFSREGTWNYLLHNAKLYPDVSFLLPGVFTDNPRQGVNGSLWTLPVELRMYILVAIAGVLGILGTRWLFNLVSVALVAWYIVAPEQFPLLHEARHERLGLYFLIGVMFFINRHLIQYRLSGVVVLALLAALCFGHPSYDLIFALWLSYLVMYIAYHPRIKLPDLSARGDFSYGLYLYAFPVTQLGILYLGPEHPWLLAVLVFAVSLLLAFVSWHLVEQPALRLKGRFSRAIDRPPVAGEKQAK